MYLKIGNSDFVHKFIRYLDNVQTWFKIQTRRATHQGQIKLNAEIVLLETVICDLKCWLHNK